MKHLTPSDIRAPFARYSHGVVINADAELLICSGQLGADANDVVPEGAWEQANICFGNVKALLRDAEMEISDVVRINAYVTAREYLSDYMRARDEFIGTIDPPPASTLMIVNGFAREVLKVEVEVIAAKPRRRSHE